jgi:AraC-like DNA-binding protein
VGTQRRQHGASSDERRLKKAIIAILTASLADADVRKKDLATRLGWTPRQVYNLFQGRKTVRVIDLILIARALRADPRVLMTHIVEWR